MQNNYEMIRMCILTFGLAGLSWEDMRKQQLHGWAILLLGISGMTISLLGAVGKIRYGFWDYCRGYLCLYWPGVQGKVLGMETVW